MQPSEFGLRSDVTRMSILYWQRFVRLETFLLTTEDTGEHGGRMSAVFAVEQIAHGFAAGGVGAFVGLPSFRGFRSSSGGVFFTAFGTAVGETRLAGLQFEFFAANDTNFDRK